MVKPSEAVDKALLAFWASIVESYPTATAGDIDPLVAGQFDDMADAVVAHWVSLNVPSSTP